MRYFDKFVHKRVTVDDVIKLLDELRNQNGEQEIIMETPQGTVSLKLKDALIYDDPAGRLVLDSE